MPHRPQSHRLEDESRSALDQRVPSEWVVRPIFKDYGLDSEIEIFVDGRATGERFPVQLKATASTGTRALKIPLTVAQCEYYRSLDTPVLLALFVRSSDSLYVAWFHALDRDPTSPEQKGLTFTFEVDEHLWSDDTPKRLLRDYRAFRKFRSGALPLPLPFALEYGSSQLFGQPSSLVGQAIRSAARELAGVITFPPLPLPQDVPSITLSESAIVVNLSDIASVNVPLENVYADVDPHPSLPYDVLISVALALGFVNRYYTASDVIAWFAPRFRLLREPVITVHVADILAEAHRIVDAIQLAEHMGMSPDETMQFSSHYIMMRMLPELDNLSPSENSEYQALLESRLKQARMTGDDHRIAIAHYNFANYVRGRTAAKVPASHYLAARRHWPPYCDYGYYCRELAGSLFEVGRYRLAVDLYERAYELSEEFPMLGVYGDALFFAGRYEEALTVWRECNARPHETSPEWRLKEVWLEGVLSMTGVKVQRRLDREAEQLTVEADSLTSPDAQRSKLHESLELDLLCARAWFGLGMLDAQREKRDAALAEFLGAALSDKWNVASWCNTLLQIFNDPEDESASLAEDVAMCAYRFHGDGVLDQMAAIARAQPADFPVEEFLAMAESAVRVAPDTSDEEIYIPRRSGHQSLVLDLPDSPEED